MGVLYSLRFLSLTYVYAEESLLSVVFRLVIFGGRCLCQVGAHNLHYTHKEMENRTESH